MFTLNNFRNKFAFSLVELMISLITISCIVAAFTPVITKKLKKQDVALSLAQTSEISNQCSGYEPKFTNKCKLCTKTYCIQCGIDECDVGSFIDTSYCGCKSCKEEFEVNCVECNKKNCTKCIATDDSKNIRGYWLDANHKCVLCDQGKYCDGVTMYDSVMENCLKNVKTGQYCDSRGNILQCTDKWGSQCSSCNKDGCTTCLWWYHTNSRGTCDHCNFGGCGLCPACNGKDGGCNSCAACSNGYFLIGDRCGVCSETFSSYCKHCNNSGCTRCAPGYYYNTNSPRTCTKCELTNCLQCADGRSASSPVCDTCVPGYYIDSSGKCSQCSVYGPECQSCDQTKCLSCKQGYYVPEGETKCIQASGWHCTDNNFVRIGTLCFTKMNMGDSPILKLSPKVNKDAASCFSPDDYCAYTATSSASTCNMGDGYYKGCSRTVMDGWAAYDTCENFSYRGLKWHVPTYDEARTAYILGSKSRGSDGLMLCTNDSTDGDVTCESDDMRWLMVNGIKPGHYRNATQFLTYDQGTTYSADNTGYVRCSVRCVTDLSGTGF